jgi:hypothetical protein
MRVDIGIVILTVLATAGLDVRSAAAQDSSAAAIDPFLGAWDLVDWRTTDATGTVRFPYGEDAQGQITYSPDGRMSAHLMRPPEDPADAPPQYLAYWGRFTVDASTRTVTHHVIGSDQRNWIGSNQVRGFEFVDSDRLILSLGSNRLTWVRARAPAPGN